MGRLNMRNMNRLTGYPSGYRILLSVQETESNTLRVQCEYSQVGYLVDVPVGNEEDHKQGTAGPTACFTLEPQ